MSLLDQLTQLATAQAAPAAAQKTNLDQDMMAKLMPMAMAMMTSRLAKNAQNPAGAEALNKALDNHQGNILSNPSAIAQDSTLQDGMNILGHVFGGQQKNAQQSLAKMGGIDAAQAQQLLAMAAPLVMGALGQKKQQQGGFDVAQLTNMLGQERQNAQAAMQKQVGGSELTGLMKMLDADGDGDVTKEMMGMGAKMLGGLFKKTR